MANISTIPAHPARLLKGSVVLNLPCSNKEEHMGKSDYRYDNRRQRRAVGYGNRTGKGLWKNPRYLHHSSHHRARCIAQGNGHCRPLRPKPWWAC